MGGGTQISELNQHSDKFNKVIFDFLATHTNPDSHNPWPILKLDEQASIVYSNDPDDSNWMFCIIVDFQSRIAKDLGRIPWLRLSSVCQQFYPETETHKTQLITTFEMRWNNSLVNSEREKIDRLNSGNDPCRLFMYEFNLPLNPEPKC